MTTFHSMILNVFRGKIFLIICLLVLSCNEDEDRFEVINKLRGVGIRADKPVVSGASTVNLEIIALLPAGLTVDSSEIYISDRTLKDLQLLITLNNDATHTQHGALTLYQQTATVSVPEVSKAYLAAFNGVVKLRYGVRLKAGSEEEIMVGDIISVAEGSEALSWGAHTINVETPANGGTVSETVNLKAVLTKASDEIVKASWFVSSGKVKNPKSLDTEWEEVGGGDQTVLLAVYPKKSRFFSYEIRSVVRP